MMLTTARFTRSSVYRLSWSVTSLTDRSLDVLWTSPRIFRVLVYPVFRHPCPRVGWR